MANDPLDKLEHQVASGLFWNMAERIAAKLVSFIVTIILARLLLPTQYGAISIVSGFIAFFDVIVTGGLATSLIQKKNADQVDFSSVTWFSLFIAFTLYIILFFIAPFISSFYDIELLTPVMRVMGIRLFISAINSVQHAYVSKHMMFRKFFFATLIGTLISAVVGIFMAYYGFGVWALVAQYMINSVIDTVFLFIVLPWRPTLQFSFSKMKELYSYGWKLLCSSFLDTTYDEVVALAIGKKYSTEALAYYDKGRQIPNMISSVLNSSISKATYPAMAKVQDKNERLVELSRNSIKSMAMCMFPVLIGIIAVSPSLIYVLLTEKWLSCVPYLQILCIYYMMKPFSSINISITKATGRSDIVLKNTVLKRMIGIIIIVIAIVLFTSPIYVAAGMLISGFIENVINMLPNRKLVGYGILAQLKDVAPFFITSVLMGIVVILLSYIPMPQLQNLILCIVVGVIIYISVMVISRNETFFKIICSLKRKRNDKK